MGGLREEPPWTLWGMLQRQLDEYAKRMNDEAWANLVRIIEMETMKTPDEIDAEYGENAYGCATSVLQPRCTHEFTTYAHFLDAIVSNDREKFSRDQLICVSMAIGGVDWAIGTDDPERVADLLRDVLEAEGVSLDDLCSHPCERCGNTETTTTDEQYYMACRACGYKVGWN